jgi:hypothetical protein
VLGGEGVGDECARCPGIGDPVDEGDCMLGDTCYSTPHCESHESAK